MKNPNLIAKNSIYLFVRLLFVLCISFYITRLTLQVLGDEDFGINNIVGGITVLFAIITMPIVSTLQRFFNVEFANNRISENIIFNTVIMLIFVIILILVLLYETVGLFCIRKMLNIPEYRFFSANIVYQISILTSLFTFLYMPYQAFLYAKENMGINALVEVGLSIFRLLFLFFISYLSIDKLIAYSLILLIAHILIFMFYLIYCNNKYPVTRFARSTNKSLFKNMATFSGWNMIESVAGICITYGSNIIINIFGGVLYNTAYGISKQVSNAVLSFSTNLMKAIEPQITNSDAIGYTEYRNRLVMLSIKLSFLVMGFIFIIFYFDGGFLFSLWLKQPPAFAFQFSKIVVLTSLFTSISLPLRTLILATGKIKKYFIGYGVVSSIALFSIFILLNRGYSIITVMYILLYASIAYVILALIVLKKYIQFPVFMLLKNMFVSIASLLLAAIIYSFLHNFLESATFNFFISASLSGVLLVLVSYLFVLDNIEKNKLKNMFEIIKSKI
jgi:O-antigen/teichoic acid export membrane protein